MLALLARSDESPPTPAPPELPLYAGFGISTPEHARAAAEIADGVIVGSRAIEVAGGGHDELRRYVSSLRTAIDAARKSKAQLGIDAADL